MNRALLFSAVGILTGFVLGLTTSASASRYAFGEREIFLAPGNVQAINVLLNGTGLSIEQTITDDGAVLDVDIDAETLPETLSLQLNMVSLPETGLALTDPEGAPYFIKMSDVGVELEGSVDGSINE
ncbi:MAG: hypothetical protein JRI25_07075 [Deltaproteobacteria bacterium]|nr:hypothetical protein [Deltaproteobacteria bacterium]